MSLRCILVLRLVAKGGITRETVCMRVGVGSSKGMDGEGVCATSVSYVDH